jgi:hypothetical protein
MDSESGLFPHLDRFLNGYMHQDWRLFGDTVEDVVRAYARDSGSNDVILLQSEVELLLKQEGPNIEDSYLKLYPNSVRPSAWKTSVEDWLRRIADEAHQTA